MLAIFIRNSIVLIMAFLETGAFCSLEEYRRSLPKRINEAHLQRDELYTMMVGLKGSRHEAARKPIRMLEVASKMGIVTVQFAFLDDDLNLEIEADEKISDGLINMEDWMIPYGPKLCIVMGEAYLKDYYDDQFSRMLVDADQLGLVI